jgi:putative transposase
MTASILQRLRAIIGQRCEDWGGKLLEFNSEADHVDVRVELPPNLLLSGFVNNVKTTSSRLVGRDFADRLNSVYPGKPVVCSRS